MAKFEFIYQCRAKGSDGEEIAYASCNHPFKKN
jgi:hypothetical protein